ncbi:N-acetylneuraminate synthase family protein [bacterium]|nr:N-acetylneuraminate synthase family protein [bacterium]
MNKIKVIAEAGVNHNGDLDKALSLVDHACDSGADVVKFQTFITNNNIQQVTPLAGHHIKNVGSTLSHYDIIKKIELSFNDFKIIKKYCDRKNIEFLSTPYDLQSASFLINDLGCKIIKIASSELTNLPLIDLIAKSNCEIILSTGMSTWNEVLDSVNLILSLNTKCTLLKCTSNYPASIKSLNINHIKLLKDKFQDCNIGFSDHSVGHDAAITAIGFGITLIEKHFTLDKNDWGPDHKASMEPDEFKDYVIKIRNAELSLGNMEWSIQEEEMQQRETMRKGTYLNNDFTPGHILTINDVIFLRPKGKVEPSTFYKKFIGKKIIKNLKLGDELDFSAI